MAVAAGVAVKSLSVQNTTLDDVFVHYTGRQLRDELQKAYAFVMPQSPGLPRRDSQALYTKTESRASTEEGMSYESNDGYCRARDAQVFPLAGADAGVDDLSAGAVDHSGQCVRRQDPRCQGCHRRSGRRAAGVENPRGIRFGAGEHSHLRADLLRQRQAGDGRCAQRQAARSGDHSAAVFTARLRRESSADRAGGRQQRQLHEFGGRERTYGFDQRAQPAYGLAAHSAANGAGYRGTLSVYRIHEISAAGVAGAGDVRVGDDRRRHALHR